jgi:SPP1 family predicted phage head-tail adaptor
MIGAGQLDRKIIVERFTSTTNALNEQVKTWDTFITYRAKRTDISDGERYAAEQVGSFLMARFLIRSSFDSRTVTPLDRIDHDGKVWDIKGVKEADMGRERFIEITAATRSEP